VHRLPGELIDGEAVDEAGSVAKAASQRPDLVELPGRGGVARAGFVGDKGPLVVAGIDTIDASDTSTDTLAVNHNGYAESAALLSDISLLIGGGERPPFQRNKVFKEVVLGGSRGAGLRMTTGSRLAPCLWGTPRRNGAIASQNCRIRVGSTSDATPSLPGHPGGALSSAASAQPPTELRPTTVTRW